MLFLGLVIPHPVPAPFEINSRLGWPAGSLRNPPVPASPTLNTEITNMCHLYIPIFITGVTNGSCFNCEIEKLCGRLSEYIFNLQEFDLAGRKRKLPICSSVNWSQWMNDKHFFKALWQSYIQPSKRRLTGISDNPLAIYLFWEK